MKTILYHYVHCPFCLRVRFALGYLELDYVSKVLPYCDEKTPVELTGEKMLPILSWKGLAHNESLDIIKLIDEENKLNWSLVNNDLEILLSKLGKDIHSLAMPYWIYTPEFSEKDRLYFKEKKEAKRGPFKKLVKDQNIFLENLSLTLNELEKKIHPFYQSESLTLADIMIASHLWGLYNVCEFQFSPALHSYLQTIKKICYFNYHQDYV